MAGSLLTRAGWFFGAISLTSGVLACAAWADDKYGIGTGSSLEPLKSTLEVSFMDTYLQGYPSCLLHFDGIAAHTRGGFIRYTGAFGRTNKYLEFPAVLILSTSETDPGNRNTVPSRSYYGYLKTPYFSSREKVGRRIEAEDATIIIEFKDKLWMDHLFYSMLEQKSVTLSITKTEGSIEEFMPPIDLTVVESSPTGKQVQSSAAMDKFRACMHLENRPPKPGEEYRFFRTR